MDIKIELIQSDVQKAINTEIKAIVRREVSNAIKMLYKSDIEIVREAVKLAVYDIVVKSFEDPALIEEIRSAASEVARNKAAKIVRQNTTILYDKA